MKQDPYATAEESASVMAKGLTTERRAAIQAVGRMMDELDTNEQGVSDEYHVKSLYDVAYKLAEQRAELLGALKKCRFDSLNQSLDEWREIQSVIAKCEAAK